MNDEEKRFFSSLLTMYENRVNPVFVEELKETYRASIKYGKRREFLDKVRRNSKVINTMDHTKIFASAGKNMFQLADILAEYIDFQRWLEKMTGENF